MFQLIGPTIDSAIGQATIELIVRLAGFGSGLPLYYRSRTSTTPITLDDGQSVGSRVGDNKRKLANHSQQPCGDDSGH
jgi:hypothetical protein